MSRQIDSFALKDCRTACALGLCYISGWKYLRSSHQNVQAERLLSSAQTPDADADALLKRRRAGSLLVWRTSKETVVERRQVKQGKLATCNYTVGRAPNRESALDN
ncbi:hypothetical protein LSTR_LSTR000673 [Laodelphax striatellus]|uniref:Uncharacterized protein n=1 Tax=Laodelphax striatellus TaxID=195883 RepID=A0A482XHB1_LAOST|nr:hypothetical protein LSTR_LSTR000673 [Laodelphax striatellus]